MGCFLLVRMSYSSLALWKWRSTVVIMTWDWYGYTVKWLYHEKLKTWKQLTFPYPPLVTPRSHRQKKSPSLVRFPWDLRRVSNVTLDSWVENIQRTGSYYSCSNPWASIKASKHRGRLKDSRGGIGHRCPFCLGTVRTPPWAPAWFPWKAPGKRILDCSRKTSSSNHHHNPSIES